MKAVLTCDDVFDVLTRAPFPSGTSDDQVVESHLAVCHECRQLAEALRPAVGLFHEALNDEVDEGLPAYRGELSLIGRCIDSEQGSTASPTPAISTGKTKQLATVQSWFKLAACLAVVLVTTFAIVASRSRFAGDESAVASIALPAGDRDATLLASLELPVDCTTPAATKLAASNFDCCTKCHTAGSRVSSSSRAILKSSAACVACHDWLTERVSKSLSYIFSQRTSDPGKQSAVALAPLFRPSKRAVDIAFNLNSADIKQTHHSAGEITWQGAANSAVERSMARSRQVAVLLIQSHDRRRSDSRLPKTCSVEVPSARSPAFTAADRRRFLC